MCSLGWIGLTGHFKVCLLPVSGLLGRHLGIGNYGLVQSSYGPVQETWVRSLDREDPLEKERATHSSILAWEIPRTEEPGGLQPMGWQKSWTPLSD